MCRQSAALLQAIKDYETNKWKVIGAKVGKPAKVSLLRRCWGGARRWLTMACAAGVRAVREGAGVEGVREDKDSFQKGEMGGEDEKGFAIAADCVHDSRVPHGSHRRYRAKRIGRRAGKVYVHAWSGPRRGVCGLLRGHRLCWPHGRLGTDMSTAEYIRVMARRSGRAWDGGGVSRSTGSSGIPCGLSLSLRSRGLGCGAALYGSDGPSARLSGMFATTYC